MVVSMALLISILIFFHSIATGTGHNITEILEKSQGFTAFNNYLTNTNLVEEINKRNTITVCAVNDLGMKDLVTKQLDINSIKNILSLHVLLDYFDVEKLRNLTNGTELVATLFQATGNASGSSGFVNITDLKDGVVGFGTEDSGKTDARYITMLTKIPYNISVIQISGIFPAPELEAPALDPASVNITDMMSSYKCKAFSEALVYFSAIKSYENNINDGLTVFCPLDDVFKEFMPKFEKLSENEKKMMLEYHALPIYQSMEILNSSNSLRNTIATTGSNYDFTVENDGENVRINTGVVKARIVNTLIDQNPLSIFTIDNVLLPKELFKRDGSLVPVMAPEGPTKKPKSAPTPVDAPADSPEGESDDDPADSNNAVKIKGFRFFVVVVLGIWFVNKLV